MTDQEKVINKVKAVVADMQEEVDEWKDYSDSELRGGLTCDCDWWYKTLQTLKDALALLKAQEPRVLTLEEALGGDECWVEYHNGGCGYADCYLSYTANGADIYRTMQHDFNVPIANYGKTWRCWDTRPTDEQREKEPWGDAER